MVPHLSYEELGQLLTSISAERDRLLAQFLYESGCSVSEASALKTTSVHKDGSVIFSDRTSKISQKLAAALLNQAATHIFHTRQSPSITPKRIQQILKPYLRLLHKTKSTPHVLRYTHILHAQQAGVSISAIAQQTGLTIVRLGQILADTPVASGYNAFFEKEGGL